VCITLISATFMLELVLFVAVFLLIRLRHPWGGRVTAGLIAAASIGFVASFVFLGILGSGYGCI
jgi:hypothetical protein